jgi:glycosyl transferase family 25
MPNVDHIYIIHALSGYDMHEQRLKKLLPETNIPFSFITKGDPSIWSRKEIDKLFHRDIRNKLKQGVLSCTLNHIYAYMEMIKAGHEYAIVFENDPYFLDGIKGFRPKVEALLQEASSINEGFIISLENTTLRFPPKSKRTRGKLLYKANQGRAAGAYLINRAAAQAMIINLESHKCDNVIDWWHNGMIDRGVVDMYWAHPALTEQGSHNGKLHAGISSKNASFFRQFKWNAQKLYKTFLSNLR